MRSEDVCSCQLKELSELKAIGPKAFVLTGTTPARWQQSGKEVWLTRIHGVQIAASVEAQTAAESSSR